MVEKVFSTRVEEEIQREFRSIVVRKGLTVTSVISQLMMDYIKKEKESENAKSTKKT